MRMLLLIFVALLALVPYTQAQFTSPPTSVLGNIYVDTIFFDGDTIADDKLAAYTIRWRVRNDGTGATLPAGTPVYLTGPITGNAAHVDSAKASSDAFMPAIGIIENDIPDPGNGFIVHSGRLMELNTSAFTLNDGLYVGSDGGATATRPSWPDSVQKIAIVTKVDGANGFFDVVGAGRTNDVPNLPPAHFFLGNTAGNPVGVDMTGFVTMDDAGVTTAAGTIPASQTKMDTVGAATVTTVQQMHNVYHSSGWVSGAAFSDAPIGTAGDSIAVAAGIGAIRGIDNDTATLFHFNWNDTVVLMKTDSTHFIGVEYNAGDPRIVVTGDELDFNYQTNFILGSVVNEGDVLHPQFTPHAIGDHANKMQLRLVGVAGIQRNNKIGGIKIGETGTRNITITAGQLEHGLSSFPFSTFNSSTGGNFDRYYQNGSGGWTKQTAETQWDNTQWDDGDGGLATLANNKYANQYFYVDLDGEVACLYGRVEHNSSASAESEAPPSTLPPRVAVHGYYIGSILFQESASTATAIFSRFDAQTPSTLASNHTSLSNLEDTSSHSYAFKYTDTAAYTASLLTNPVVNGIFGDSAEFVLARVGDTTDGVADDLYFGFNDNWDNHFLRTNETNNSLEFHGFHIYAKFHATYGGGTLKAEGTVESNVTGLSLYSYYTAFNNGSATAEYLRFDSMSNAWQLTSGLFHGTSFTNIDQKRYQIGDTSHTTQILLDTTISGHPIDTGATLGDGHVLAWNDASGKWEDVANATADSVGLRGLIAGENWSGVHDFGSAASVEIPNGANPTTDAVGEWAWDTDDSACEVFDGVRSVLIPTKRTGQFLIWNPDLITDTIPVMELDSAEIQNGIVIENLSVLTSVDGTYALKFFIFTSADPPVLHDYVDTLNVGASDQFVSSNTFENVDAQTLDVGQRLYMLTPSTDIDWIKIKFRYHIKDNN